VGFVLAAIALPVVGNGLRAAALVLIAHLSDLRFAMGIDHLTYGYVFTAVLLAGLVGLAALLGSGRGVPEPACAAATDGRSRGRVLATAAAALSLTALPALAARAGVDRCERQSLAPPEIGAPWLPAKGAGAWRPAAASPDAEIWQGYRSGGRTVDLYVGYYCAQREGAEAVSQAHRLSGGRIWVVLAQGEDRLGDGASELPVRRLEVKDGGQRRLVLVWYWVAGRFTDEPLVAKLLQTKAALLGGPDAAAVIVASAPYAGDPDPRLTIEQAMAALEPLDGFLIRLGTSAPTP
jgi:EpsI family protein